ncbi:unnamed protein product [Arctia plantaginis]|uniref:Lipase domain-containing protein n=1 Tax=Arctia plantaginis TaxID=874455 RepID=A0A8S1B8L7_ARCPL|nr:unnamed protein product [Arctia plantaginis]
MLKVAGAFLILQAVFTAGAPTDPVLGKFSEGLRYDYMETDAGDLELVDNWLKLSDYRSLARFNADQDNVYLLFTRSNPIVGQVLQINNAASVRSSNYSPNRRTVVLIHGFAGSATSRFNNELVPAFLAGDDCNVIVVDWSAGSMWGPRAKAVGQAGARFVNWLMAQTGSNPNQFTIVGYSVGGHGAGILGRNMNGRPSYIIACDPADRWDDADVFQPNDGLYTEVIHTDISSIGMTRALGHVDFYPNQGTMMPGCLTNFCNHEMSFRYIAESMRTGGFLSRRCPTIHAAIAGNCQLAETINMGGILPKTGRSGIFFLRTRAFSLFSQG